MHPQVISFRCKIMSQLGKVLSISYNEDVINQLGDGDPRLKALIHGLQSVKAGETRRISVPASRAYGPYDPSLSIKVDAKSLTLGKQINLGSQIVYPDSDSRDSRIYRVVEKTPAYIVLEGNHFLAGIDLIFEVEIISARKANREDLAQQNRKWFSENIH